MKTPPMRDSTYKQPPHLVFSIHVPLFLLLSSHYSLSLSLPPSPALQRASGVNSVSKCMSKVHATVLHYAAAGVCSSGF